MRLSNSRNLPPDRSRDDLPLVKLLSASSPYSSITHSPDPFRSHSVVNSDIYMEGTTGELSTPLTALLSLYGKPEAGEVKNIAAEGIITCLQDTIESLNQGKGIRLVMDQWMFVPHVVKELGELEGGGSKKGSLSKDELSKLATTCKTIYEGEFDWLNNSPRKEKKQKNDRHMEDNEEMQITTDDAGFDSDQTIEMTEEEIELACKQLSSDYCK